MRKTLIAAAVLLGLAACKKDHALPGAGAPATPGTEVPAADDRRTVLLKEITASGLPGPLYRFSYDTAGYATALDYAAGFHKYRIDYSNRRVTQMTNTQSGDVLRYDYRNGQVTAIRHFDSTGRRAWTYGFRYNPGGQLQELRWYRCGPGAADSLLERQVALAWGADGNLASWTDTLRVNGLMTPGNTTVYSDYDNGVNVDDFYLFRSFFEEVLYLPGVRLQRNNPRSIRILGSINDYAIDHTYSYAQGLPVLKTGRMRQTRGGNPGQEISLRTSYSYY
ncbi:MAG: hypothetical protein EOO11_08035 [Chitinophagaceae bacterium]|nr:MAG: hypothetical protein EOO11_08035 [Chitinophagaceae bacterium]